MVAKFRADLSAFNGPESQREQISNGIQRWEAQVASDLSALEEAKALSITQSKKDLQEQAEKTWPLPKKHTLAERAKIESKWTTWVNQEWEMAKKELMKIYSLD